LIPPGAGAALEGEGDLSDAAVAGWDGDRSGR
jgi:hypothetical protein